MARITMPYRVVLSDGRTPGVDMPNPISYEEWLELPKCDRDCFKPDPDYVEAFKRQIKVDNIEWRLNDD